MRSFFWSAFSPLLDWIRRFTQQTSIFSPNAGKYGSEKAVYLVCRRFEAPGPAPSFYRKLPLHGHLPLFYLFSENFFDNIAPLKYRIYRIVLINTKINLWGKLPPALFFKNLKPSIDSYKWGVGSHYDFTLWFIPPKTAWKITFHHNVKY